MGLHNVAWKRIIAVLLVAIFSALVFWQGLQSSVSEKITATIENTSEEEEVQKEEALKEAESEKNGEIQDSLNDDSSPEAEETEPVTEEIPEKNEETKTWQDGLETAEELPERKEEEAPVKEEEQPEIELTPPVFNGPVHAFEEPKTMYALTGLNVRTGPGTEYEIVGRLKFNEAVGYTGTTDNGWYQLLYQDAFCYVSGNYLSETKQEPAPQTASAGSGASGGVIMIGDSRCVQMQAAVGGGGCAWVCQNAMGYKWLNETAIPQADPSVGRGTKVVICLGVNDPGNVRNYAELVNAKAAEWGARGARVYYVSVNPVWENPHVTQEQVDNFNNTMPGLLSGVTWIDTQSWMKENGYRIVDGLHYDDPTSINVFNLIMGSI